MPAGHQCRWGRLIDLHFRNSGGDTLHQYQYAYDAGGNRTSAHVTQATAGGTPHVNDRSYLYGYDALSRLISAERVSSCRGAGERARKVLSGPMSPLRYLEELVAQSTVVHEVEFRRRGLLLRRHYGAATFDVGAATAIPAELVAPLAFREYANEHCDDIRACFLELLASPYGAEILWHLYCTPVPDGHSLLSRMCPSLGAIVGTVRGGPNTYKLNGWLVHVLAGYGMVARHFANGSLPPTIPWPPAVEDFVRQTARPIYQGLDRSIRTVLHLAMLGHDLGVAVGVPNHHVHGVPLVEGFLREVSVTPSTGPVADSLPPYPDLLWAVEVLVRLHTYTTRLGSELSVEQSRRELAEALAGSEQSGFRSAFVRNHLANLLLLIGAADLAAVDDTLLTARRVAEIVDGRDLLADILGEHPLHPDTEAGGFKRFRTFLRDEFADVTRGEVEDTIRRAGYPPSEFWRKFYNIRELHFALSLAHTLESMEQVTVLFLNVFAVADRLIGAGAEHFADVRIEFDPALDRHPMASELPPAEHARDHILTQAKWQERSVRTRTLEYAVVPDEQGWTVHVRPRHE